MIRRVISALRFFGVLLPLLANGAAPLVAVEFDFLAIGDVPYGDTDGDSPNPAELAKVDRLVKAANGRSFAFTVHVGDLKRGSAPCRRRYFDIVRIHFDRLAQPFILTPGDNDWTDCHRSKEGLQPEQALRMVREVFYANPRESLGKRRMALQTQRDDPAHGAFVENARWEHGGVWFATLHVVGENDNQPDIAPGNAGEQSKRMEAALAWMKGTFARAREARSPGAVLFMQADPWQVPRTPGMEPAYTPLLLALEQEVAGFPGAVLLVHGDGHTYCINRPLRVKGRVAENFTRVQVFGEAAVHGVSIHVNTSAKPVFTPSTFVVAGNPIRAEDSRCPAYR